MPRGWIMLAAALALAGCESPERAAEPVVDHRGSMEFLQAGLRPEEILFPEHLFLDDFQIERHGRVPERTLVGAGLRSNMGLSDARGRYNDALDANGWTIDKMEVEKNAFRIAASRKEENVEIRGVQGTGETKVFLLYEPDPANVKKVF